MSILGYLAYGSTALYNNAYVIDFWSASNAIWPSNGATTNVARAANLMVLIHSEPAAAACSTSLLLTGGLAHARPKPWGSLGLGSSACGRVALTPSVASPPCTVQ